MCCLLHKVAGECHIFFEIERLSLSCLSCSGHPPLKIKHFVVLIFKAERNKLEQNVVREPLMSKCLHTNTSTYRTSHVYTSVYSYLSNELCTDLMYVGFYESVNCFYKGLYTGPLVRIIYMHNTTH